MNKKIALIVLFFSIGCHSSLFAKTNKGEVWAKKVYNRPAGDSNVSLVDMILQSKGGKKKQRQLYIYNLDDKKYKYNLIRFIQPADIKEVALLTKNKIGDDANQWVYLPALGKGRRITSSGKGGRFVGSDIFYEDLQDRTPDKDTHRWLGQKKYNGVQVEVIESVPVNKKNSVYKKKVVWIHPKTLIPLKIEYYKKNLKTIDKVMETLNVKKIDNIWTVTESVMRDVKSNHKTFLRVSKIKYNINIKKNLFSNQTLKDSAREAPYRKF